MPCVTDHSCRHRTSVVSVFCYPGFPLCFSVRLFCNVHLECVCSSVTFVILSYAFSIHGLWFMFHFILFDLKSNFKLAGYEILVCLTHIPLEGQIRPQ